MSENPLIVVADCARARLFEIIETDAPRAPFALRELESLVHPVARTRDADRYSSSPASAHSGKGAQSHVMDDHRGAHDVEERRRFAKEVSHSVARSVKARAHNAVITVSTHALHSLLVRELERELPKEVPVRSEVGELSERSPSALLEELARRGALQS